MKKLVVVAIAMMFALVGCMGNNTPNKDVNNTENTTYEQTRYNDQNVTKNKRFSDMRERDDRINRKNDRDRHDYSVSKEAADRITAEVDEINNAYVITTRNNAYVAATLNKHDNNRNKNNDNNRNTTGHTDNDANSNMTDRTANDANRDDDLTDDVKEKVADIVQSVDNNIDNVYVTTSPDFINLSEQYANDLDSGKPVRGFFDQIGNAIERLFPQDRGTGNFTR